MTASEYSVTVNYKIKQTKREGTVGQFKALHFSYVGRPMSRSTVAEFTLKPET